MRTLITSCLLVVLAALTQSCGKHKGGVSYITVPLQRTSADFRALGHNITQDLRPYGDNTFFDVAFDGPELKILVVGHLYEIISNNPGQIPSLAAYINAQNADIVVLGGDSIYGAQDESSAQTFHADWAHLNAFIAQINAKVIQVAGNHDGWSYDLRYQDMAKDYFKSVNLTNFGLGFSVGGRSVALDFVYTGDFYLDAGCVAGMAANFPKYDNTLMFGGMRMNATSELGSIPVMLDTFNPGLTNLQYFSGDYEEHDAPITMPHVSAYNVSTVKPDSPFKSILIAINKDGVSVNQ
jgi:hypothetical protein